MEYVGAKWKTRKKVTTCDISCRCEENVWLDLMVLVCEGVDWIHVPPDRIHWLALLCEGASR